MSVGKRGIFCICCLIVASKCGFGQAARSPYSAFGIGETFGNALASNQGMAGLGLSRPQFRYVNNQNPALLAYNLFTVFSAGIIGEQRNISNGTTSESTRAGSLNYMVVAFPVKYGKMSTSLGLMPYTNADYYFEYNQPIQGTDATAFASQEGKGGLTQLYWSNGVKVHPNVAVGVKASYIFGSVANIFQDIISSDDNFLTGIKTNVYSKGVVAGLGISFSKDSLLDGSYRFSAGATYDIKGNIASERTFSIYKITFPGSDTIQSTTLERDKGKMTLPSAFGGGISFGKDRQWTIGLDYNQHNWSEFRSLNTEHNGLDKAVRWALGGEITPDVFSTNYLKRVTYRAGASYDETTYKQGAFFTGGNRLKDFGINFGLSLPAGRSSIDLAIKSGSRGTFAGNGIKENYIKVYLGVTLNDQWFIKRRFD